MRSGMMSPMQMTSTTSDQLGCHTSRKYRSRQYSTPIAIRPTAPMHMAMEERRERLPSRSRKLSRNTTTHVDSDKIPTTDYVNPTEHVVKISGATKETRIVIAAHPYGTKHYRLWIDDIQVTKDR